MRTINISIGHDNNLVIPQFANVIIIGPNTSSQGRNHRFDFFIFAAFYQNGLSPHLTPCREGAELPDSSGLALVWLNHRRNLLPPDISRLAPDLFPDNRPVYLAARQLPARFCDESIPSRVWLLPWRAPASIHLFSICLATDGFSSR